MGDMKTPLVLFVWFLLVFVVVGSVWWGVLAYHLLKDIRRNEKEFRRQMSHIRRLEDDGK